MKFGLIGYGSIGQRHVRNLFALGYEDIICLRKIGNGNKHNLKEFTDMQKFLAAQPDAIILANPTSFHAEYLTKILDRDIHVFVEKPIVTTLEDLQSIKTQIENYAGIGMTAYNMHFHPCVCFIKKILSNKELGKTYSARFFVGQFLPDWRSEIDYSKSYSAKREMGGGVLFDLIHEIDLACYLVGEPIEPVTSQVNIISDLQIETEDLAEMLYRTYDNSIVSIHLDYLSRNYQRYIEIIAEQGSLRADLFSNKVIVNLASGKKYEKSFQKFSRNDMYLDMLSAFITCLEENQPSPISLQEGLSSNRISIDIRNKYYEYA